MKEPIYLGLINWFVSCKLFRSNNWSCCQATDADVEFRIHTAVLVNSVRAARSTYTRGRTRNVDVDESASISKTRLGTLQTWLRPLNPSVMAMMRWICFDYSLWPISLSYLLQWFLRNIMFADSNVPKTLLRATHIFVASVESFRPIVFFEWLLNGAL